MKKDMYCFKCNSYLGNIIKGEYKKDMYFLCSLCKSAIDLSSLDSELGKNKNNYDMPSCFNDLFKGKL